MAALCMGTCLTAYLSAHSQARLSMAASQPACGLCLHYSTYGICMQPRRRVGGGGDIFTHHAYRLALNARRMPRQHYMAPAPSQHKLLFSHGRAQQRRACHPTAACRTSAGAYFILHHSVYLLFSPPVTGVGRAVAGKGRKEEHTEHWAILLFSAV